MGNSSYQTINKIYNVKVCAEFVFAVILFTILFSIAHTHTRERAGGQENTLCLCD